MDYAGAVDRLLTKLETGSPDDTTLWLALAASNLMGVVIDKLVT